MVIKASNIYELSHHYQFETTSSSKKTKTLCNRCHILENSLLLQEIPRNIEKVKNTATLRAKISTSTKDTNNLFAYYERIAFRLKKLMSCVLSVLPHSFAGVVRFRHTSGYRGGIHTHSILALFELYVNNDFTGRAVIEVSV